MEEISIFDIILGNEFYVFITLFANSKDVFILTCDIWEIDRKSN